MVPAGIFARHRQSTVAHEDAQTHLTPTTMKTPRFLRPLLAPVLAVFGLLTQPAPAADAPGSPKIISVVDADALLKKDKSVVVLDVRTPEEFKAGHIPGAINVDFNGDNFDKELAKLDRNKTYLLHCAAGGRSAQAEDQMVELKFQSVLHLKEGFNGWKKQGKPIEK